MKKRLIFIVVSVLLMLSVTIYMAVHVKNSSYKNFIKSGYVLSSQNVDNEQTDDKTTKYYFDESTNYKNVYDEMVEFKDTSGEKIKVGQDSFVHYTDGDISLLKKGVIFNLSEINSDVPKYYNLFEGTLLTKSDSTYLVNNLGKKLEFSKFVIKINDNKYLFVSDNFSISLGDNKPIIIEDSYLEVNFVEEGIVRIENLENSYQTIAKDAAIDFGDGITLNLDNKYFYYNEKERINLKQIIIDSSDNIDISPVEENNSESSSTNSTDNGTNGSDSVNNSGVDNGIGGNNSSVDNGNLFEYYVDNSKKVAPTATIEDVDISANRISASIKIDDNDSLVTGNAVVVLINNSTGNEVARKEFESGTYSLDVDFDGLSPDTTYSLTTTISYKKNNVSYTTDVVQQIISTESLGVSIEKDCFTDNSLSFLVKFYSYSKVKSVNVVLYRSDGTEVNSYPVSEFEAKNDTGYLITFGDLDSNTKYIVKVNDMVYDNYIVSDNYSIEYSAKTLKKRASVGYVDYVVDKRNSVFTIKLNDVVDPDNGIENFRYEIYDDKDEDMAKPVAVYTKNNSSSFDIPVDGEKLSRNRTYICKTILEFYDNEKYIEYYSPDIKMTMDGKQGPNLRWNETNITFEKVSGNIYIDDPEFTIKDDSRITVIVENSVNQVVDTIYYTFNDNSKILDFEKNNLQADSTYYIRVYASVDLDEDNNSIIDNYNYFVGTIAVKTTKTKSLIAQWTDDNKTDKAFSVEFQLTGESSNMLEAKTLSHLSFSIKGNNINKTININDVYSGPYDSKLKEDYFDKGINITPEFFGLNSSDFSDGTYVLTVSDAYDYTDFKNVIGIESNTHSINAVGGNIPTYDEDKSLEVKLITNKEASSYGLEYDGDLNSDTYVGIKASVNYDNENKYLKNVHYYLWVYNDSDNKYYQVMDVLKEVSNDYNVPYTIFKLTNGTIGSSYEGDDFANGNLPRGYKYAVSFDATLQVGSKEPITWGDSAVKVDRDIPKQYPSINMYLSSSSSNSAIFKYNYFDVDNSLIDSTLYSGIDDNYNNTSVIEKTSEFKDLTIQNLTRGYLMMYGKVNLYKYSSKAFTEEYNCLYFDGEYTNSYIYNNLSYNIDYQDGTNKVKIILDSKDAKLLDKIAKLRVTFSCADADSCDVNDVVKDVLLYRDIDRDDPSISTTYTIIDLYDLSEFKGKNVKTDVTVYFDTGISGFDLTNDKDSLFLLQIVNDKSEYSGQYISFNNSNNSIRYQEMAAGSIYKYNLNNNIFTLISDVNKNNKLEVEKKIINRGIKYLGNYILLKKIDSADLNNDGAIFKFDEIVPGISVDEEIGPSAVRVTTNIYTDKSSSIDNDSIYMQLSYRDEDGKEVYITNGKDHHEQDYYGQYSVDSIGTIDINNLNPNTYYTIKFYAYINDHKVYLYDIDSQRQKTEGYTFKTLTTMNFDDIVIKYEADSYNEKNIYVNYSVSSTIGYSKVRVKVYKCSDEQCNDSTIMNYKKDITDIKTSESIIIPCNPGSEFAFNNYYKLELIPIIGSDTELEGTSKIFNLNVSDPFVIAERKLNDSKDGYIYSVTVFDKDQIIFGSSDNVYGEYNVNLFSEGIDITPGDFNATNLINEIKKPFNLNGLINGKKYNFKVTYKVDLTNDGKNLTSLSSNFDFTFNNIYVGDISSSVKDDVLYLSFKNSDLVSQNVDTMQYNIYDTSSGTQISGDMSFEPELDEIGDDIYYTIKLIDVSKFSGTYVIQLQFLKNGVSVADASYNFTQVSK